MLQTYTNHDCRNYAPLDVAKGICHARKQLILADGEACELFERLPKCKHCAQYAAGEVEYLGVCAASPARPMTYPDLIGVTCEQFSWKED
jgi:4-hydroxyphenylacetate decarboxylase small subunit